MDSNRRLSRSSLLPVYHEILEKSPLWGDKRFPIAVKESTIIVGYRNWGKIFLFGGINLAILVFWGLLFATSEFNMLMVVVLLLGLVITFAPNLYALYSAGFSKVPVKLNIEHEKLVNLKGEYRFDRIRGIILLQNADMVIGESKQYFSLKITDTESADHTVMFGRYFDQRAQMEHLGSLLQDILGIHGLNVGFDPANVEFDNNFQHYPNVNL